MNFIELNKKLKEKIEPLYNIVGDDLFLIKQAIINIKTVTVKDFEEFNFVRLDAEKLKKEQINEQILTMPLIGDYRLIVLDNPNQEIVQFLNKFEFENINSVIVCVNANKLTVGETIDCNTLTKTDITKYILNYLSKCKLSIEEQALDYIIEATNSNMTKINNELNKIAAYCVDLNLITIDIVTNLISNTNEYAVFTLTNAIDNKDYSSYQKILKELTKSQSLNDIFAYMGKYFKRMQYIALDKRDDEISKILNIKPYAIKISRQFIVKNGVKFYINLYEKYINLDYMIKSGKISTYNALYELIF